MAARRLYPTVPQQVRERLAVNKAAGVDFDVAWERATFRLRIRGQDSSAWRIALAETRPVWRDAYEDRPGPLAALAGLSIEELTAAGRPDFAVAA